MYSLGNTKGLSGNHFYHIGTLLQALHRGSTIQEIEPEEKFYLHTVKFNPNVTIYPKVVNEDPEEGYDDDFSIENVNETDVVIYDNGVEGLDYPEPLPDGCKTANQNPNYSIYTHSRNFKVVKVEELTTGWDGDDYDDETNQHLRALYAACKLEYIPDVDETKEAPAGHYFTKSGNLVKGRMSKDAKERGARKSDPKDKQRSKVPKVTQYTETSDPQDGKAVPYGSGYKKVTKEDIRNLVVGLIHEMKNLNYNNFIQMVRDDMMAGAAPDEYPSDERVRKHAKALYSRYLKGASLDDLFETKDTIEEKDDRCTRIAKRKYDTWPSAYASGAVVRCRRGEIWKKK